VPTNRTRSFPLLRVEKGFQWFGASGPAYDVDVARPVQALVLLGKPRLFLVRGGWNDYDGCVGVPSGDDFLTPKRESDVFYRTRNDPYGERLPDWDQAVALERTRRPPEPKPKDSYDFLVEANKGINSAYYGFIGRASNDEVFRPDDQEPGSWPGMTVSLLDRMIKRLQYLRAVYSADRETIKAWRRERIEAYDGLEGAFERQNRDRQAYEASPEFKRSQAITGVRALDYQRTPDSQTTPTSTLP
jgi:hypothetical protein